MIYKFSFQLPFSDIQNGGTLEKILLLQRAFGRAANVETALSDDNQDSPLVFIVV